MYDKGLNNNTDKMLFESGPYVSKNNAENRKIFYTIDIYNLKNVFARAKNIVLFRVFTGIKIDLKRIKYNSGNKRYEYSLDNGSKIKFLKLSEYAKCDNLAELDTKKRYGHCHSRSLGVAYGCKNSKLLSGIANLSYDFCHSVVELENGDIIDWTRNLIMKKEDYIKLTNFRTIQSIDSNDLNELIENEALRGMDLRAYLYFRDEIVADLEKHQLLKK